MMIRTKHFGVHGGRSVFPCEHWSRWTFGLGFVHGGEEWQPLYRYGVTLRLSLIPNFIWYQTFVTEEYGKPVYQCRIIGIHGWPFWAQCYWPTGHKDLGTW